MHFYDKTTAENLRTTIPREEFTIEKTEQKLIVKDYLLNFLKSDFLKNNIRFPVSYYTGCTLIRTMYSNP